MWQGVRDRLSQAVLSPDCGQQRQGETEAASTEIISSGDSGGAMLEAEVFWTISHSFL